MTRMFPIDYGCRVRGSLPQITLYTMWVRGCCTGLRGYGETP